MKHNAAFLAAILTVVVACASWSVSQQKSGVSAAQQKQLAALKELRDDGVLNEAEYQAKLQAITGAAQAPAPASATGGAMRTVEITDPALGMTAASVDFPAAWKFAGTVARPGGCISNGGIRYAAENADGDIAFEKFPNYAWSWNTNPNMANGMRQRGCTVMPIITAADFLREIMIPRLRPGAQVLDIGPMPPEIQAQLDAQLKQMHENTQRLGASYGFSPEQSERISGPVLDGARAHIVYTRAGQPVEEMLQTVINCSISHHGPGFNTPPSESALCSTQFMGLARAPQGQLESLKPVFKRITLNLNPEWSQKVAQIAAIQSQQAINASWQAHNQLMQQSAAAAAARTQQWQAGEAARQVSVDNSIATARAQQNALDQSAIETEKYSLGIQSVVNPSTGTVSNVSNAYGHTVQRQSDGKIFQYNDPAADPRNWADPTQVFTEMQPVQ